VPRRRCRAFHAFRVWCAHRDRGDATHARVAVHDGAMPPDTTRVPPKDTRGVDYHACGVVRERRGRPRRFSGASRSASRDGRGVGSAWSGVWSSSPASRAASKRHPRRFHRSTPNARRRSDRRPRARGVGARATPRPSPPLLCEESTRKLTLPSSFARRSHG
jgi:hypothetical protein